MLSWPKKRLIQRFLTVSNFYHRLNYLRHRFFFIVDRDYGLLLLGIKLDFKQKIMSKSRSLAQKTWQA